MKNPSEHRDKNQSSQEQLVEQINDFLLQLDQEQFENETEKRREELYQFDLGKAKILARFGCYKKALLSIDQAIALRPGSDQAWIFRGNMLLYLDKYEAALTSFQQALKIQPRHQAALFFCSVALYYLGQNTEAYLTYQKALELGQKPLWKKLNQIFNHSLFRFYQPT